MNWIKRNNKYILPNNDISYSLFKEQLQNEKITSDDSYVYIPTHNINDVFEWYRIFWDSYAFTDNFDKYGFAIHGWFSKQRGQSIEGWFPNLYEVRLATSDEKEYFIDNNTNFFRRSIDFIDNFANVPNLKIDGTDVLINDVVLIKNQNYEELFLFDINNSLTNQNIYYVEIQPNDAQYFNINNDVIIKDSNNEYHKDKIINLNYTNINGIDYAIVTTNNIVPNALKLADLNFGLWLYNTQDGQNGIYRYDGIELSPIIQMYDKYQTYNQIVYTYLGKTNQNKQFYLRRIEDKTSPNFTYFPYIGLGEPLFYSEGEAYLVKCKIHYDLSIEDNSGNFNPNCCFCNLQNNTAVAHPTTNPPYDINSTAFRLLFLDNSIAERIFSSDSIGVGKYVLNNNIDITNPFNNISFDINNQILEDLYFGANTLPTNNFIYQPLNSGENYNIIFDDYIINGLGITQNTQTIGTNTYLESTTIELSYNNVDIFPINIFQSGDYCKIIIKNQNNEIILDHIFVIQNSTLTVNDIELTIYQPFSEELINEITGKDITWEIYCLNHFGLENNLNLEDNRNNLLNTINNTIVGKIYEFLITEDNNNYYLEFIKIRQNIKQKYFDLICEIIYDSTVYTIDNEILNNYRQYFYGYNIEDYLTQYLGLQNSTLPQLETVDFIYEDNIFSLDRFDIFGANKNPQRGNIITFGNNYKQIVLDTIKKHTLVKINYNSYSTEENIFIYDIIWNEDLNYGEIILSKDIQRPAANGEQIQIEPYNDINEISDKLKIIFDKKLNDITNPNFIDFPDYRIETNSYAFAFMNYAENNLDIRDEIINNLTGIFYNSYNETQVSLLKRDRFFAFDDDDIINVQIATDINIDITNPPTVIDGYTILINDLILVKEQNDLTENGIYLYNGIELIRYNPFRNNIYWFIENGSLQNVTLQAYLENNFIIEQSPVIFVKKSFRTKSDPRLTLTPVEICKLGVDNETNPCIKINNQYDMVENTQNLLTIQPGINAIQQIRFIDGLTEFNILNNINGQGQYAWILDQNVITQNAVVGCTQTNGPGTGDLIWYTGTWVQGIWCNGIWMQGQWLDGIWLNGIRNSFVIIDNYYTVNVTSTVNNLLSIWKNGEWYNGTNNAGIFENVHWYNGIFNNGIIIDGIWETGTFNNGTIQHIKWFTGNFHGGDFLKGEWFDGNFEQLDPSIPARFGFGSSLTNDFKDRAIWRTGIFNGGEFYAGLNNQNHNSTIWYNGHFITGIWNGGTFISGVFENGLWKNGVWFGGYYITSLTNTVNTEVELEINPEQYDAVLGLINLTDYVPNNKHNLNKYQNDFILSANPTTITPASEEAFINVFYLNGISNYIKKEYIVNTATDTEITLDITSNNISNTYVQPDPNNNILDGNPFIMAEFSGTFESGIWLNGYFNLGNFQTGVWINGFFNNGNFGII